VEDPVSYQGGGPASSKLTQLNVAAIILIVVAALSWLYSGADVAVRLWTLSRSAMPPPPAGSPGFVAGFKAAVYVMIVIGLCSLVLSPVLIVGAAQMLRRRAFAFARISAILAMLPITTNCCCIATLPLGIWALVLLNSADVRDAFTANFRQAL
jgi:hypothetical protein